MPAAVGTVNAFEAFRRQLRTLCLDEFPCGYGSWRSKVPEKKAQLLKRMKPEDHFTVTMKEYGANLEKAETLQEYTQSDFSPWNQDYSWSEDARTLREIAVRTPWLVDDDFILAHFKTLRIIDLNITDIDPPILNFTNLKELTLSANHIREVVSKNLPCSLQVLELYSNDIADLSSLTLKPPPLTHLGLGSNKLYSIGQHFNGKIWPNLLSLDLSYNNLTDFIGTTNKLLSMPVLQNLILQGNPLTLVPAYRGFLIDAVSNLTIIDDIRISADERHNFKHLAQQKEHIVDEGTIILQVPYAKGIPMPAELRFPEDQPEFPIVERKYFIEFTFLDEPAVPTVNIDNSAATLNAAETLETKVLEQTEIRTNAADSQQTQCQEPTEQSDVVKGDDSLPLVEEYLEGWLRMTPIRTTFLNWQEVIELDWTQTIVRKDLVALRDFIQQGVKLSVKEEKVLYYPVENTPSDTPTTKKGRGVKTEDKAKGKQQAGGRKGGKNEEKKKKKKKQPTEEELQRMPPEYFTLATFHISLESFLQGEFDVESHLTKEMPMPEPAPESRDGKKSAKDKKKGQKVSAAKEKNAKDSKKQKRAKALPEENISTPPTLELKVNIFLHHWTSTNDAIMDQKHMQNKDDTSIKM